MHWSVKLSLKIGILLSLRLDQDVSALFFTDSLRLGFASPLTPKASVASVRRVAVENPSAVRAQIHSPVDSRISDDGVAHSVFVLVVRDTHP